MNTTWIVVPVIDSSFDYSTLLSTLKGGYVPSDIVTETTDEEGNTVVTTETHPNDGMTAPDFSDKIVLVHRAPGFTPVSGTTNVVVEGEFNISKLWNAGVSAAYEGGASHAAVLNYISNVNPFIIEESVTEAESADLINVADGSLFIIKTDSALRADEQFSVYFADLDLFGSATSLVKATPAAPEIATFDVAAFIESVSDKIAVDGQRYEAKHA